MRCSHPRGYSGTCTRMVNLLKQDMISSEERLCHCHWLQKSGWSRNGARRRVCFALTEVATSNQLLCRCCRSLYDKKGIHNVGMEETESCACTVLIQY